MPPKPSPTRPNNKRDPRSTLRQQVGRYLSLGIQLVVFVLLGTWGGHALDGWVGTDTPYFTAAGALVGCLAAMFYLIRHVS